MLILEKRKQEEKVLKKKELFRKQKEKKERKRSRRVEVLTPNYSSCNSHAIQQIKIKNHKITEEVGGCMRYTIVVKEKEEREREIAVSAQ